MKTLVRSLCLLAFFACAVPALSAQARAGRGDDARPSSSPSVRSGDARPSDPHRLEVETALQQYARTDNSAGMGLFQPASGSVTSLNFSGSTGDYHRAQEGRSDLAFCFSTLRYDRFTDELMMRGSFYYRYDSEKDRKWSDVMDPYYSIPFIYGSAVAKDYDSHHCGLDFDLYTTPLSGIVSVGIKVNYEVADISGRRDPRPRTGYLGLRAIPSLLLTFGKHHIGLDAGYGYSKEKLNGLTTVQTYPNLYYYRMSGLDQVEGTVSGYSGFKRQFEGHRAFSECSYSFTGERLNLLLNAGFAYEILNAFGDNKQTPGSFNAFTYRLQAALNLRAGNGLHTLSAEGSYKDGGADEYLQEKKSSFDEKGISTQVWETLYTYKNRYVMGKTDVGLSYIYYGGIKDGVYRWSVGADAGWNAYRRAHYLPFSSAAAAGWSLGVKGSCLLLDIRGHKLDLSLSLKGYLHTESSLSPAADNLYVREVLLPDRAYYARDFVRPGGELTWQFPLKLGKAGAANGYVRLSGGSLRAFPTASLHDILLSVGLFTF